MEIDHQKEVGDQPRKQLDQHAVVVSGDEMIDLEVLFPPGEKGFHLPSERKNEGDLPCRQIFSVGGDEVGFASAFEAHQVEGMDHLGKSIPQ